MAELNGGQFDANKAFSQIDIDNEYFLYFIIVILLRLVNLNNL